MSELKLEWIKEHVADPKIILDIGAFEGRVSRQLKQLYPFSRILATEACRENYDILKNYCNSASGIERFQYAFCDHIGEVQYWGSYSSRGDACHGSLHRPNYRMAQDFPHVKFREPVMVPAMTIEALVKQLQLPEIDVLLVRMWGAEGDVLLGLGGVRPKLIFLDILPDDYYEGSMPRAKVPEFLKELGYRLHFHGSHGALYVLEKAQTINITSYRNTVKPSVPLLSILTPSIPSRLPVLATLIHKLECQIGNLPIEHLVMLDNKMRTVGLKREALVQSARGQYCAFVDDDDDVSTEYCWELISAIREHPEACVIVFDQICQLGESKPFVVKFGMEHENEPALLIPETMEYPEFITRKPFHVCAWRTSLAKLAHFPDTNYGEDQAWCEQLWPLAKTQHRIDRRLHVYRFNEKVSEAPDATNPVVMHKLKLEGRA